MSGDEETDNANIGMTIVSAHDLVVREYAVIPTSPKLM
jgi:hypothetical protein